MEQSYTFIESGYFVPLLFAAGVILGLVISTNWFKKLGTYTSKNWYVPVVSAIGGGALMWGLALVLRNFI